MSNQISVEQSEVNARAAAAAAVQGERARVTSILAHPRARECFALALQCVSDGVNVVEARAALGPDTDGAASAPGSSSALGGADENIAASWDKAFGVKRH
jgi:hypothetical protein